MKYIFRIEVRSKDYTKSAKMNEASEIPFGNCIPSKYFYFVLGPDDL